MVAVPALEDFVESLSLLGSSLLRVACMATPASSVRRFLISFDASVDCTCHMSCSGAIVMGITPKGTALINEAQCRGG